MLQPKPKFNPNQPFKVVSEAKPKFNPDLPFEELKKKGSSESNIPQPQQTGTTDLPLADGSLATQQPTLEQKQEALRKKAVDKYNLKNEEPFSSPLGKAFVGTTALLSSINKSVYETADNIIVSARKALQEEGFFDDDIPDTETPITDAVNNKVSTIKNLDAKYSKPQTDGGPLDPTPLIKGAANFGLKIINSTLPQDKKNAIIAALNLGDQTLKRNLRDIQTVKSYGLPKDNIPIKIAENVLEIVPDLVAAEVIGTPAAAEGRLTKAANEITKDAKPLIQKYLPKAAKFIEEAVKAPFTKIMAGKGAVASIANAKEGEDIVETGVEGGLEGAREGIIMHGLGVAAGKTMPVIAKQISKTGLNSTWATGLANPLANAGVFTTAKAIRTPIEEGRLATEGELINELGTGIGFSLLHAGSLAKNHNELNHYADNVLKTDATESIKRVANETKDNLELVYNPDLTPENISQLETVRDEMKSAVLKEPDLQNKQLLINEALKIQNQLDAHSAIDNIVKNKDILIEEVNSDPETPEDVKEFYTKKIAAIADHFDNSEFSVKKKELNAKIDESQKKLDDAALVFTNLKKPSDRIEAKIEVEKRRQEVEDLNNELTDLITNKVNENAVQKPTTDESVLRTEQPQLELQGVGEGNAQPEGVAQEETIITEKPKEVVTEETIIQDSQIPLKRETFEYETDNGNIFDIQVTTKKDGSRDITAKDKDGNVINGEKLGKDNTLTTEEYISSAYGEIKGEPKVEQGVDIMTPTTKSKLTPEQKVELGIEEVAPVIEQVVVETKPTQTVDEAIKTLQESKEYAEADDIQKENLVRATRKEFGLKEKAAPSVNRLFGKLKDIAKITITEKAGLIKQIKDTARGARQSIQEWKKQTKDLTDELKELKKAGKITLNQQTTILDKFGKVNIFSEKSINRFTDYVTKVFADANYKDKLTNARKNLSSIKRLSKNEEKNGDLRALGTEFVKIDPSIVKNIDEYNDLSFRIKEAIDGSKIRKSNVSFAETVNIEKATEYIEKTLKEQEEKLREEKIAELQDLLGVDAKDFSAEEIDALLQSDKELSDAEIKIVRSTIKKGFDVYSTVIKEMLSTGEDPFTGEDVSFDKKQEDLIKRFMDIDPNKIEDPKEALRTVDALINFIQNKSTAGMLKPIADYEAIKGGDEAIAKGLKAIKLRKYFSENFGRALAQTTTSLPVLAEKMFKGVNRSLEFEELVGISDLINNSSKAESETNSIAKEYISKFYEREANGEAYNTAYNDVERGVLAHIMRNVIGSETRMKNVFDKRKQEVLDAIDLLSSKGNDSEKETAILIKKAYDKILDGSENIKDVKNKTDINNVKGVEYWVNQWSKRYEPLADLSLNFYNKVLGKDLGYTPDKVVKLQDKREDVDLEDTKSQFFANTDEILYDKKSGTLMDKQENRTIPKDMYIDFSFDKKNANAMSDALTDLYTAFDIRKVGAFLKSENFKKIIPSSNDASLYDKRIKKFVKITRRKTPFQNNEVSNLLKNADRLAKLGITMSLASGRQPFIQTIPVFVSTAINAGGVNPIIAFEPKYKKWLDDLGYAVSNRGIESQGQIESMNKLLEKAADMPRDKALKFIEKIQDESLKLLLVKGDVAVARASFKAYYEQSLKQQGKEYKNIDYSDHEPNKKAANYAERMVDRQQNISNPALAGDLFTSESTASKVFIKMLMPFSSFRMNQSSRLGSDLSTLEYWNTSTKQDKIVALKSIAGYTAEAATYRALQIGAGLLFNSIASYIMDKDNEKEDKKSLNNSIKGAAQGTFVDTFSPIPLSDPFTQDALAYTAEEVQDIMERPEKDKIKLFESKEQTALKMLGTYGIPIEKAKEIYDLGKLAYGRKYKDKFGNEKKISQVNADKLKVFIAPLIAVTAIGAFSPDVSAITRKAIKMSQKKGGGISKEELKKKDPEMYKIIYGDN